MSKLMKIMPFLWQLVACGGDLDSTLNQKHTSPLSSSELAPFQVCSEDSDCKFVTNGCCDCANGGDEIAINSSQEADFNSMFDCSSTSCTEMARTPPCGCGTVSCVGRLCTYNTDTCGEILQ